MVIEATSLAFRLLIAVLLYFLFKEVIDTFVTDTKANKIFRVVLLMICLGIVFLAGFIKVS